MIYTGSYTNFKNYTEDLPIIVSISGDRGKMVNFEGKYFPSLAPKFEFWKIWHENIGKIDQEENTAYYIREYVSKVLKHLDPHKVFKELDNSILLCYEPSLEFCHRHIVALWLEKNLNIMVPEVIFDENNILTITNRNDKISSIIINFL